MSAAKAPPTFDEMRRQLGAMTGRAFEDGETLRLVLQDMLAAFAEPHEQTADAWRRLSAAIASKEEGAIWRRSSRPSLTDAERADTVIVQTEPWLEKEIAKLDFEGGLWPKEVAAALRRALDDAANNAA